MSSTHSDRSFLNLIVLKNEAEDVKDPEVKDRADKVQSDLHLTETPFNWQADLADRVDNDFYQRAVSRNHIYTWEGYLNPFVQKILQAYYAMCKNDRLMVIKCLTMAEKCIRKGEQSGNHKILIYCVALRHIYAATVASVFFRCSMFKRARQFIEPITPLCNMDKQSVAFIFFMKSLMLYYTGVKGYPGALQWTTYALRLNQKDPELRFLNVILILNLWDEEICTDHLQSATRHLRHNLTGISDLQPSTFANFYNATACIKNVQLAVKKIESCLNRISTKTTPNELNSIELEIVECLEVQPRNTELISFASHFFISTNQPEKSYLLEGISRTVDLDSAYRWLDYRMLLFPEVCRTEVFRSLLEHHLCKDAVKIYKRIAFHYIMYEPDKAFFYANKALSIEKFHWLVTNRVRGDDEVPIYDEKQVIFGTTCGIGFYRFMTYYAHVLSTGEQARQFLEQIQELLPTYLEAIKFSQECQKMMDILLKNEFYRVPLKVPLRGSYPTVVIHCYDD